jgi:hypothetical protein
MFATSSFIIKTIKASQAAIDTLYVGSLKIHKNSLDSALPAISLPIIGTSHLFIPQAEINVLGPPPFSPRASIAVYDCSPEE